MENKSFKERMEMKPEITDLDVNGEYGIYVLREYIEIYDKNINNNDITLPPEQIPDLIKALQSLKIKNINNSGGEKCQEEIKNQKKKRK